jgi:molybdenum cofactor synthesis domain-containing protein
MAKPRAVPSLDAETIAIGTELLIGGRSDFNSLFIADELGKLGIAVRFKSIVGDERQDIVTAIHTAAKRARVIIMTGGLGPTVDDCTREAVARPSKRSAGRYDRQACSMGPQAKQRAIAAGDDSVRGHRAQESSRLCAGFLLNMEEGADHLLAGGAS